MSRPASRRQHQKFCEIEGWEQVSDPQGRPVGHHLTYRLTLADGRVLRTRISRPANNDTYGPQLWSHILSEQLAVTAGEFWECVGQGNPPVRPGRQSPVPADALPADLVHQLLTKLHLSDSDVAALTRQQAIDLMTAYWSTSPTGPSQGSLRFRRTDE